MVAMPLAHVSWAIADNADRKACDDFFLDVFGAETVFEILITPENEGIGLDREERLMLIGDTMVIPIAPAGAGARPGAPIGDMLRRSAGADRWLGVALKVADLAAADAWLSARGFRLHYDPGMEAHYFLISRKQAMGMRIEVLKQDLPNDPRCDPAWSPARWRDDHPLGIEGLQAIGLSATSLDAARDLFAGRFEWPEIPARGLPGQGAECAAFAMGDTVLEAMVSTAEDTPLAAHLRDVQGICCLTFKIRNAAAAAGYLRGRGLTLMGDTADRFAIVAAEAQGRTIWFTENTPAGYPAVGSRLDEPARFPLEA